MEGGDDLESAGLSQESQRDIQELLQRTEHAARVNNLVNGLAMTCFRKCIKDPITENALSRGEEGCVANCVARFFDSRGTIVDALAERQRSTR